MADVQIGLADIYTALCPDCQKKLRRVVADKLADAQIEEIMRKAKA
jgi:hypothetical protein